MCLGCRAMEETKVKEAVESALHTAQDAEKLKDAIVVNQQEMAFERSSRNIGNPRRCCECRRCCAVTDKTASSRVDCIGHIWRRLSVATFPTKRLLTINETGSQIRFVYPGERSPPLHGDIHFEKN
jgi:hypothetical protein